MNCSYSLLQHEALLHISGPDTLTFLQGQTTCDTREVDAEHAALGVYCTPQGRVVCDFLLLRLAQDHYALRMRRAIRAAAASVFGKYIVFSKAELDAERDDCISVGIWGPDSRSVLEDVFGAAPGNMLDCVSVADCVLVQMDADGTRFEAVLPADSAQLQALAERASQMPESAWQALQIAAGIARIEPATMEAFVPQVLNYDLTGHISFTKGCYTGQEVVARLHYRGKSKRRTYIAELPAAAEAGDALFSDNAEQSAGTVVNVATSADAPNALVATTAGALQQGLHLRAANGPALTLREPPYALPED